MIQKITNNLKIRLLVGLFLFLFIIFYGFGSFLIRSLKDSYTQTIETSLVTAAKDIKHDYKDSGEVKETLDDIKEEFDIYPFYAQVIKWEKASQKMERIATSEDLKSETIEVEKNLLEKMKKTKEGIVFTTIHLSSLAQEKLRVAHMVLDENEESFTLLSCGTLYKQHTPYVTQMTTKLWIGLSVVLVVILVLMYLIISRSFLSVQRVIDEARSIKVEDIDKKITKTHIATEIDNLIDTFNELIFELQHAYMSVKQFGQNASHELKTPLTIIRGEIEVGLKKERTKAEYEAILHSIHKEIIALQDIIEKILFLSSITKGAHETFFETIYVDEIVQEAIAEKKDFAQERNIVLHVSSFDTLSVQGNATLLKIAIANLIDNAIKYSFASTSVNIALYGNTLRIENQGEGISREDRAHIFEKFYRSKKVHGVLGSGLGLSIVEAILNLHGFKISVQSRENQSTTFSISF